jgi:hypothetical protein
VLIITPDGFRSFTGLLRGHRELVNDVVARHLDDVRRPLLIDGRWGADTDSSSHL